MSTNANLATSLGAGLGWVAALTRRLGRQMEVIGRQLEGEAAVESRYRLAHPHNFGPYNFESAQVGIYISNLDGEILDCNEAFARLLGCASPQEFCRSLSSKFLRR